MIQVKAKHEAENIIGY